VDALMPSTAAQAGLSRSVLHRGARAGRMDRIARGIYLPAEASAADWDLLEAATRRGGTKHRGDVLLVSCTLSPVVRCTSLGVQFKCLGEESRK
jgi:hypothetical protein